MTPESVIRRIHFLTHTAALCLCLAAALAIFTIPSAMAENPATNIINGTTLIVNNPPYVIGNTSANNLLIITNGGVVMVNLNYPTYGDVYIGNASSANTNSVLVIGSGSLLSMAQQLAVGKNGSFNTLTIANGGTVKSENSSIGDQNASSNNTVWVSGAGSVWSNSSVLNIGYNGSGNQLIITNGGQVISQWVEVGDLWNSANNSVWVTGTGSILNATYMLEVGLYGTNNGIIITNGGAVYSPGGGIGGGGGNGNYVIVSGAGSVWSNTSGISVGDAGSGGSLTVSDGGKVFSTRSSIGWSDSNNTVLITGTGSIWNINGDLICGGYGSGNLLMITNGGQVLCNGQYSSFAGKANSMVVTGPGSLWSNAGGLSLTGVDSLKVANGGLVLSSGGSVVGTALLTDPGSVWSNNGGISLNGHQSQLTMANGSLLYSSGCTIGRYSEDTSNNFLVTGSGTVWINNGTLYVGVIGSANSLIVSNGAQVFGTDVSFGDYFGNSNAVIVSGLGSTWSNSGGVAIGGTSSGCHLAIGNGGQAICNVASVGSSWLGGQDSVLLTDSGSLWLVHQDLSIGSVAGNQVTVTSNGTLQVGGTLNNAGAFTLASATGSFSNIVNQGGGTFTNVGGGLTYLNFMNNAGASATFDFLCNRVGSVFSNAGVINAPVLLNAGQFTMTGGTLSVSSAFTNAAGGTFNLSGGSVRLVSNATVSVSGNFVITNATLEFAGVSTNATPFLPGVTFQNGAGIKWAGYGGSFGNHVITGNLNLDLPSGPGLMRGIVDNASLTVGGGSLLVGSANSGNTLLLTNGGTVWATNIVLGASASSTGNVVTVSGGILDATNSTGGGAINVLYGTLNLNSGTVAVDRLLMTNFANSVFNFNGGVLHVGQVLSAQPLTINGGTLTLADSFVNSTNGTFQLNSGSVIVPGSMTNQGSFVQTGGMFDPAFYDNTGSWLLTGGTNVDVVFLNEVTGVMLQSGGEHDVNVATNLGVWTLSGGVANITNLFIESGGVFTNSGGALVSTNTSGLGIIDVRNGALVLNSGTVTVNQFVATNFANNVVKFNGGTLNSGGSALNNGSIFQVGDATSAATLHLLGGSHSFANGLFINTNSWLTGTGAITGVITNAGSIAPGDSPGILTVSGDLTLLTNSLLAMELAGTDDWLYDQLNIAGTLNFDGALTLSLLDGFNPHLGDRFDLFDFSSSSGAFSATNLPSLSAGLLWDTSLLYSTGEIEVDPETPVITTSSPLPSGAVGVAYSQVLAAIDGLTPYTWSLSAGSLPSGLTLSSAGVISGTPDTAAAATFTVQVTDNDSISSTRDFSLMIHPPPTTAVINGVAVNDPGTYIVGTNSGLNALIITNGGVLTSAGGVIGNSAIADANRALVTGPGSLWNNSSSLYVGSTGAFNTLTLTNGGVVSATNIVVGFESSSTANVVTVSGSLLRATNADGGGALEVRYGAFTFNSGTVTVDRLLLTNGVSSVFNFNGGTLNSGGSVVTNGARFMAGNGTSAATLHLAGGTHSFADGLFINTNGWLTGTGAITGVITNAGSITPGDSLGIITANNSLTLLDSSLLLLKLAGTNNGLYDQINVAGTLTFGGTLTLSLLDGFTVSLGDRFDLFDFSSSSGTFSQFNLPGLDPLMLMYWDTSELYTSGEIKTGLVPPGVIAWGYNGDGQTNVPVGLTAVAAISAGEGYNMALRSDGTVVAWGGNGNGETNVPAGLSEVSAISAGSHSMALKRDGTIVVWGENYYGQTNVPVGLSGVVAIAAGTHHSLAIQSNGTVVAWGNNYNGQANVPAGLSGVVAVAGSQWHSLALQSNGTVVAWGGTAEGQTSVPTGLSNVVAIAAGPYISMALKNDGTVIAWGDNGFGQLTVPTGLSNVVAIAAASHHSAALKSDGTVVVWGENYYGQTNVPAGLCGVVAMEAKNLDTIVLRPYGPVVTPSDLMLPSGVRGTIYNHPLQATGGMAPYSWSVTSGRLPPGLTLDSSGTISGTPTASGLSCFRVRVTGADGLATDKDLAIQMANDTTPLTLLAAVSRKTHGAAGTFDVSLNLNPAVNPTVEPRKNGPTQLLFTFNKEMMAVDGVLSANEFTLTNATYVSASILSSNLTLNLTNAVDQSKVTVVLNGLSDLTGNPLVGTNAVVIRALHSDANQSGTVNIADMQTIKFKLGSALSATNFIYDLNLSGAINIADMQVAKSMLSHTVPANSVDTGANSLVTLLDTTLSATGDSSASTVTLGEALGAPELVWNTDGDAVWTTTTSLDGSYMAWSGSIGHLNVSWVETTVTGPGTLSFQWKVSSEADADYLTFSMDGEDQPGRISGEVDWQTLTFSIPEGTHRLTWTYAKNRTNASGLDAGWLRRVLYQRNP